VERGHGDDRFDGGVYVVRAVEAEVERRAFDGDLEVLQEVIIGGDGDVEGRAVDYPDLEAVCYFDLREAALGEVSRFEITRAFDHTFTADKGDGEKSETEYCYKFYFHRILQ